MQDRQHVTTGRLTGAKAVLAAIEAAGGVFEDNGSRTELKGCAALEAPGRVWYATGCHTIAVHYHSDRPAGWAALGADVAEGTAPCDTEDCEYCNP